MHTHTHIHTLLSLNISAPSIQKINELLLLALTSHLLLLSFASFFLFFLFDISLSAFLIPGLLSCGPPVHKSFINNSVNNVKSIVFSKVVLINMNEFICLHQSMINAH